MNQTAIFYPVVALVGWTLLVLLMMPYRRFKAASAGQVKAEDFKLGESERVPPYVRIPNRNYMNLLEAPVLFYVTCMVLFQLQSVGQAVLVLAWIYVVCRIAHSLIHLTYNNVIHRLLAFALSNGILATIWLLTVVAIQKAA